MSGVNTTPPSTFLSSPPIPLMATTYLPTCQTRLKRNPANVHYLCSVPDNQPQIEVLFVFLLPSLGSEQSLSHPATDSFLVSSRANLTCRTVPVPSSWLCERQSPKVHI